jgi:imidazolonepropionase-like amidohydrolase
MHRAGVKILAGTDTANPFVYPGGSLHDELSLLVRAGLTPMEALQAATIRAAEYLGLTHQLGSIAPGKLADLVLLDRDPLTDIQNTRSIAAVIKDGKMYSRSELSQLRAAAEVVR